MTEGLLDKGRDALAVVECWPNFTDSEIVELLEALRGGIASAPSAEQPRFEQAIATLESLLEPAERLDD